MASKRPRRASARWPFWILLAAWWCANTPQAATFELILWCKGAAHFSHQQQLRSDVASLLSGVRQAPARHWNQTGPVAPPAAPLLAKVTVKRLDLCVQGGAPAVPGKESPLRIVAVDDRIPARRSIAPLLRPPRAA